MTLESAPRFRLHLENGRERDPIFHMTTEAWSAAAARHPDLAAQVQVSIGWDGDVLEHALTDAQALVAGPLNKRLIAQAPRLDWLHTTGAGVDHLLPLDWLPERILLTNSSGVHADKAEDYVSMALLMLHTRMPETLAHQWERRWRPVHTPSIVGRTALILGYGDVGQAAGRGAQRLGLKVIAVTRSGTLAAGPGVGPAAGPVVQPDEVLPVEELDAALPRADFLVITLPLTAQSRHLVDARRVHLLPPGAGVINIGRAAVLDYYAVAARLAAGELSGAMMDVFETEPLPSSAPWWEAPNMIVTPHISCDGPDYIQRVLDVWFANFARRLRGEALANRVDRARGY